MPITKFTLGAIEAKRYVSPDGKPRKLRIDHNVEISRVYPEKEDVIGVEFRYTVSYGHVGMIKMEGVIFHAGDKENLQMEWEENHRLPKAIMEEVHNYIFRNLGGYECLVLSRKLDLPPPFPQNFPRVKVEDKKGQGARKEISYSPEIT